MGEKLKLAQIRALTENPVRHLTEFEPDTTGESVADISNLVVVNLVLRRNDAAKKHLKADPKHPSAIEQSDIAKDTENWANNMADWDTRMTVTEQPPKGKKKRR